MHYGLNTVYKNKKLKKNKRSPKLEFLDLTIKASSIKEKTDSLDLVKIKNFCSMKDLERRQATDQGSICKLHMQQRTCL